MSTSFSSNQKFYEYLDSVIEDLREAGFAREAATLHIDFIALLGRRQTNCFKNSNRSSAGYRRSIFPPRFARRFNAA
jgi:hypothetical protein